MLGPFFQDRKFRKELKALLGFMPSNASLYRQAFTHKSAPSLRGRWELSNERLEFLGDAVLNLIITDYLFERYPDEDEGHLSKIRSRVVNRELFNELGRNMSLHEWMKRVAPYAADLKHSPDLLGNSFEALIGAIFIDKGFPFARKYFEKTILVYHLEMDVGDIADSNYKSKLLEWGQKNNKKVAFHLDETQNKGDGLMFRISVIIDETVYGRGLQKRKKKAEQDAAKEALTKLGIE